MGSSPSKELKVKESDMPASMQNYASKVAIEAMDKYDVQQDIARHIKQSFDSTYGTMWHCIVGQDFGSFVSHEAGRFIYFTQGDQDVLLFKT